MLSCINRHICSKWLTISVRQLLLFSQCEIENHKNEIFFGFFFSVFFWFTNLRIVLFSAYFFSVLSLYFCYFSVNSLVLTGNGEVEREIEIERERQRDREEKTHFRTRTPAIPRTRRHRSERDDTKMFASRSNMCVCVCFGRIFILTFSFRLAHFFFTRVNFVSTQRMFAALFHTLILLVVFFSATRAHIHTHTRQTLFYAVRSSFYFISAASVLVSPLFFSFLSVSALAAADVALYCTGAMWFSWPNTTTTELILKCIRIVASFKMKSMHTLYRRIWTNMSR